MKNLTVLPLMLAGGIFLAQAQSPSPTTLPVYHVVKTGASDSEAAALAKELQIPAESLVNARGKVSFVDSKKFLTVPTAPVTDAETVRRLREATKNKNPETEIRMTAIDAKALEALRVLDEK
ncbi:MAG: hypothetical protein WAK26_08825, partial [Terracidiphilus sp.]